MLGTIIAAVAGRDVDERDGEGGTAGALVGIALWKAAKTLVPLAALGATILVASRYLKAAVSD